MSSGVLIEDCCIACLGTSSLMYDLRKHDEKRKLLEMYIHTDFQKFNILSFCENCDEKLNDCHAFFVQVNNSINYIQQHEIEKEIDNPTEHLDEVTIIKSAENSDKNEVVEHSQSTINFDQVTRIIEKFKEGFKERRSCLFCDFMAENKRTISTHMALFHKEKKPNWCSECNKTFENITEHKANHKTKHTCPFCNKEFISKNYIRHLLSHSENFDCDICHKSFKSPVGLRRHTLLHAEHKPYMGLNCGEYFTNASSFRLHLNLHEKCDTNDVATRLVGETEDGEGKSGSLYTHHTQVESKSLLTNLRCKFCDKIFNNNYKLRLHMRTHTGELPYKCSFCDKRMTHRSRLRDHERVHTKEKPYICSQCSKRYGQRSALNTHMKQHTGKPEICEICNKTFSRKSQLKLHMDKHMGLRPFLCNQCGRSFAQKSHLTDHLKGHANERPYQCELCDKAFKKKTLLKGHLRLHQDVKPFQCSFCEYACCTAYRLQQHEKLHINKLKKK